MSDEIKISAEGSQPNQNNEAATPAEFAKNPFVLETKTPADLRKMAIRQIWIGLAWWSASVIAIVAALLSTADTTFFYFGGLVVAPFSWFRSFRLFREANAAEAAENKTANLKARIAIAAAAVITLGSAIVVGPEYVHVNYPSVGTCYGTAGSDSYVAVACFAPDATYRAVSLVDNPDQCPAESDMYFDPVSGESKYTCLVSNK